MWAFAHGILIKIKRLSPDFVGADLMEMSTLCHDSIKARTRKVHAFDTTVRYNGRATIEHVTTSRRGQSHYTYIHSSIFSDIVMNTFDQIQAEIRRLGRNSDFETIAAGMKLFAPLHEKEPYPGIHLQRDLSYGDHQRHKLDIYQSDKVVGQTLPVFLFVHGGGFVGGDKHRPDSPYNDNVGLWAARNGMIGVVMNYRLAPDHTFPAGAEDVNRAIQWLYDNIANFGGDPNKIIAAGTSAGANHVATCIALPQLSASQFIRAAILLTNIYDMSNAERNDFFKAYFGEDESKYAGQSNLVGLLHSDIPLLVTLAEFEPPDFERQALIFLNAYFDQHGHWPNFLRVMGHNHFTTGHHINSGDNRLGGQLLTFIQTTLET